MILSAGCAAVGPDYAPPKVSAPTEWNTELQSGLTSGQVDPESLAAWWSTLRDTELTSLIERAIKNNLDLRQALARVREARARRGIAQSGRFPSVDATGAVARSRSSGDTGLARESDLYSAGFDAGWELDFFGRIRRSIEAADADLRASEEDFRDVQVTLAAETALNYIEVRSFQTRLSIAESNRNDQEETYQIALARFEAGLTNQLDVEQARYNFELTRSQIPTLQTGLEQARNRLAILLGQNPGSLKEELTEQRPIPVIPLDVAVGIPADALRNRPDIRRAERQLASQTAQTGVATAELYPKFNLLGSIGLEALSFGNLFLASSRTYRTGSNVAWNIFDTGALRRNIEVHNALQEQALIRYEAAIMTALEEVENALIAYADEQVRRKALLQASEAARHAVELSRDQYVSGLVDFQVVLDAQRSLLSVQDQLAESEGTVISNLIRLYKSLGGGWTSLVPDEAPL